MSKGPSNLRALPEQGKSEKSSQSDTSRTARATYMHTFRCIYTRANTFERIHVHRSIHIYAVRVHGARRRHLSGSQRAPLNYNFDSVRRAIGFHLLRPLTYTHAYIHMCVYAH